MRTLVILSFRLLILITFLHSSSVHAQNFEWLKRIGNKTRTSENMVAVTANKDGGSTCLFRTNTMVNSDSLRFDTALMTIPQGDATANYLVRFDAKGKTMRVELMDLFVYDLCGEQATGNLYLSLRLGDNDTAKTVGGTQFDVRKGAFLVSKMDSNFNLKWVVQMGNFYTADRGDPSFYYRSRTLSLTDGKLIFTCEIKGSSKFGSKTYNPGTDRTMLVYGEINPSNGTVVWSESTVPLDNKTNLCFSAQVVLKNKLYVSGAYYNTLFDVPDSNYVILKSGDTLPLGSFVMRINLNGTIENALTFRNDLTSTISALTTDGDNLFFGGCFFDSIPWGNRFINSQYTYGNGSELFVAAVTPDFGSQWLYQAPVTKGSVLNYGLRSSINQMVFNNGYLYLAGYHCDSLVIDSNVLVPPVNGGAGVNRAVLVMKMDLLGNVLWATNGGNMAEPYSMDVLPGKAVYLSGYFASQIEFKPHSVSIPKSDVDGFLLKITDYSIFRGDIFPGPYCAGDTIEIPYSKIGNYYSNNIFIAQLSNEQGNFDKGYRELGRLKSDTDGIIYGRLPLFKVASSAKYRIRVLSTAPAVQSYYRADSLRLLIYSKDKADPGKDTSICLGDTISIETFGGTEWHWSPGLNMADSSARATRVWPTKETRYQIIIGDSSGCGEADTAYKTLFIKSPPQAVVKGDTISCPSQTLALSAAFSGGDTSQYIASWYELKVNLPWKLIRSVQGRMADTLVYQPDSSGKANLALVLSDQCSKIQDTVFHHIQAPDSLQFSYLNKDTLVCKGQFMVLKAPGKGGRPSGYQYQWLLKPQNSVVSVADSFPVKADSSLSVQIRLSDDCMQQTISQTMQIRVRDELKASVFADWVDALHDTLICYNDSLQLLAKGSGGKSNAYQFQWFLNQTLHATGDTLKVKSKDWVPETGGSLTIALVLNDGCTNLPDTFKATLSLMPVLKADVSVIDTVCFPAKLKFAAKVSGGKGSYTYQWLDEQKNRLGILDSLIFQYSDPAKTGSLRRTFVLSDACSANDTVEAKVYLRPELKLQIYALDTCPLSQVVLNSKSSGGRQFTHQVEWFRNGVFVGIGPQWKEPSPTQVTVYQAVLKDACSENSDTVRRSIGVRPSASLRIDTTEGCDPHTALFVLDQSLNEKYTWTFFSGQPNDSVNGLTQDNLKRQYSTGTYQPGYRLMTAFGCTVEGVSGLLTVYPSPVADFTFTPLKPSLDDPQLTISNSSKGASTYLWEITGQTNSNGFEPIITFKDTGTHQITLIAATDKGCADTATQYVRVEEAFSIWMPSSFSPNNDGHNDVFVPVAGRNRFLAYTIYNRWGEEVFKTNSGGSWDGTYQGENAQEGLYIVTLEVQEPGGRRRYYNFQLLLLR